MRLDLFRTALWTMIFAACVGVGIAAAAMDTIDSKAAKLAILAYHKVLTERAPGLFEPLVEYEQVSTAPACDAKRVPVTHAILIGAGTVGPIAKINLPGPPNDVEMVATLLSDRGVDATRIHRVAGTEANRAAIAATISAVLAAVGCEDRVLFHFSGTAVPTRDLVLAALLRGQNLVDDETWVRFFSKDAIVEMLERFARRFERIFTGEPDAAWREVKPLVDDEVAFLTYEDGVRFGVFLGRDISNFMTAVRNKGAHAVAILDSNFVALSRIEVRQRQADLAETWRYQVVLRRAPAEQKSDGLALVPGHGSYTVFYAAGIGETTPELLLPKGAENPRKYGLFTSTVASELLENASPTARSVAESIQESYGKTKRTHPNPLFESSSPDLVLIAEVAPPLHDPIRILSPAPQRGASVMQKAEIDIEGIVDWNSPLLGVFVDEDDATLGPGGHFKATVALKPGLNLLNVRAITADNRMHSKTLELVFEGDRKALEGDGKRYAVVIANQNYSAETGMPSLSTPLADADALASVLTSKYGFATELMLAGGKTQPLVLKDATKRDIEVALHQLGKAVGSKDTVLIFYAGHGIFEPVTSIAYWVPSDAEAGFEPSFLSAADISAAIQRIQAGHVILISDSCYSGALLRGGPAGDDEKVDEQQRMQALLKLQSKRSRIVITSGNNEPVADLGGEGHSIFASALLTGLEKMDQEAFSARELFDGYILHQVTANADQEPQYRPLEKVGHEGGDFVFVRVPATAAAN